MVMAEAVAFGWTSRQGLSVHLGVRSQIPTVAIVTITCTGGLQPNSHNDTNRRFRCHRARLSTHYARTSLQRRVFPIRPRCPRLKNTVAMWLCWHVAGRLLLCHGGLFAVWVAYLWRAIKHGSRSWVPCWFRSFRRPRVHRTPFDAFGLYPCFFVAQRWLCLFVARNGGAARVAWPCGPRPRHWSSSFSLLQVQRLARWRSFASDSVASVWLVAARASGSLAPATPRP